MKKKCILFIVFTILTCSVKAQTGNVGIGTTNPGSKLTVNGSFAGAYTPVTSNTYAVGENDFSIMWNGTANGTLTLPSSTSGGDRAGRLYYFKNRSSAYTVTVDANGTELIDDNLAVTIQPGESILLTKTNINTATGTTYVVVQLTQSQQPYMYTIKGSTAINALQGTSTLLTFSTVEYSTNGGGDFDAATSSWICPQSGWYDIDAAAEGASVTNVSHASLQITRNGVLSSYLTFFTPVYNIFGSGYVNQKINLTKGDAITIRATPCGGCGSAYTTFSTRKMNITRL